MIELEYAALINAVVALCSGMALLAIWLVGATIWVTRINIRVNAMGERQPVEKIECAKQQVDCQAHIDKELSHGSKQFEEIKTSIKDLDTKLEIRHNLMMDHLLKG
ncbi:hypothetical protein [Desulfotalea psychrophila]|uniref:Uncharacterized protein n=1 Tax=Desulfotalea psychrophila (strain LSv54 / DSM 12343) TaxID=177439 RepID=Q6AMU4_DESPS|nr:hypothetical protein [Desulfotalea psychrophila]CAG36330.1 unknown protein [Desulfotalea psychrophila LSv54]